MLGRLLSRRRKDVEDGGWRRLALSALSSLQQLPIPRSDPKRRRFDRELANYRSELESAAEPLEKIGISLEKATAEFAKWQRTALADEIAASEASTRELLAEWDDAIHAGDRVADAAKELARSFRYIGADASLDDLRTRLSKEMEALIFIVQERDRLAKESELRFAEIRQTALHQLAASQEWTEFDSLTKLANRANHEEFVRADMGRIQDGESAAMAVVSIDGLVAINEELGFRAGDLAIVAFGRELADALGSKSIVARLYGGCFVVNLAGSVSELRAKLESLEESLQESEFELGEDSRALTFHFGVIEVDRSKGYDELMARADLELKTSMRRSRSLKSAS